MSKMAEFFLFFFNDQAENPMSSLGTSCQGGPEGTQGCSWGSGDPGGERCRVHEGRVQGEAGERPSSRLPETAGTSVQEEDQDQAWLPLVPETGGKPKLGRWLKEQDIGDRDRLW